MSFFEVVTHPGYGHNPDTYCVREYVGRFEGMDVYLELPGDTMDFLQAERECTRLQEKEDECDALSDRIHPIDRARQRIYSKTLYEIQRGN